MTTKRFLIFWITITLMGVGAWSVAAQEDVLFLEPTAGYTFGEDLHFGLAASNAGAVETITLFLQPQRSAKVYQIAVPFDAGEAVEVMVSVPAAAINLQPFQRVNYGWELQTADGIRRVAPQVLVYEDNGFEWQQLEEGGISAHWVGGGPFFGEQLIDIASTALQESARLLGLHQIAPLDIYVYPSAADLQTGLRRVGPGTEAGNLAAEGVLLVSAVNAQSAAADLQQSLPPLVVRFAVGQAAGAGGAALPWWFTRGLETRAQAIQDPRGEELLAEAAAVGRTLPLWRLCQTPLETGDNVLLATAQSRSLIGYIERTRGVTAVQRLAAAYFDGRECEAGARVALGQSLDELERSWLADTQPRSPLQAFWSGSRLWLALLLGGALFAALLYRITLAQRG